MTRPSAPRARVTGAVLAGLCLVLGACTGGTPTADPAPTPDRTVPEAAGQEDVATLEDGEGDGAPSAAAVHPLVERYGEPVRLRLDFTEEESTAAYARFEECVAGETADIPMPDVSDADGPVEVVPESAEDKAKADQAFDDCMVVAPLPPWEYDVQNPDAVAFTQAVVDCLRGRGVQHAEVTQDAGQVVVSLGGEDNHGPSISLGMEHHDACEQEVAASWGDR
jgi:hypothetical protein